MFHAVFLITVGILLLANNFDYLPWSIWSNLFTYWPILIVFVGIDVILGKSQLGNLVAGIINSTIFLAIVARIVGLNVPYLDNIPIPSDNKQIEELLFTNLKLKQSEFLIG